MEEHKQCLALFGLLFVAIVITMTTAQDFNAARQAIAEVKPNINYSSFCMKPLPEGEEKIACRIDTVQSVGFLVCKTPVLDGAPCKNVIEKELGNMIQLNKDQINAVAVSSPQIDGVKCGETSDLSCSGFLEEWVDKSTGEFQHVRDHISGGTIPLLINKVKDLTTSGLPKTADDLSKIKAYMEINPSQDRYRQICDLQGFFLVKGGFQVNDTPDIVDPMSLNESCWDGEPTTKQILDGLDLMIAAFRGLKVNSASSVETQECFLSILFVLLLNLVV